jgi:hypothetical protein
MPSAIISPGVRLGIGFALFVFAQLSCPMDFDHMGSLSIWRRFWLGVFSTAAVVTLVPVFWRGRVWQRVVAGVLVVFPLLSMFEAFSYLSIKAR